MKFSRIILYFFIGIALSVNQGKCQDKSAYDALATEYLKTRASQDSVQSLIDKQRQLLDSEPSRRDEFSASIIKLEDQLYNLNTRINTITRQINEINPGAYLNLVESYNKQGVSGKQSRNLINNSFFADNLTKSDLNILSNSSRTEANIEKTRKDVFSIYNELTALHPKYIEAKQMKDIDSLLDRSIQLKKQIKSIDESVFAEWHRVYDKKIESYLILADKIGVDRSDLEKIEEQSRNVRAAEASIEKDLAPNSVIFDSQRKLVLSYELMLAKNLQLTEAQDSIQKRINSLPEDKYNFPDIEFEPRSLVLYSKVSTTGIYDFEEANIPEVIVPQKGVYYAVQVMTLQNKVKQIETFRKITPLRARRLANGSNQYLAGGFEIHKDAAAAQSQIARMGFKNTAIIAWVDGKISTVNAAKAYQEAAQKANNSKYQIEIFTQNASLISRLREIVDGFADNKQISRTQRDNQVLFIVAQFDKEAEAEELADIIRRNDRTEVNITKIEQ